MKLTLVALPGSYGICRLAPDAPAPAWAQSGTFLSVTRTPDELSIVCPMDRIPPDVRCEKGWRCLKVQGPLDFALTGVLASLAVPLTQAGISLFAISTFDTDYLLLKQENLNDAIAVLQQTGHRLV